MTEKTTKKKLVIISIITTAVMVLLMILLLSSCKGNTESTATADEIVGTSVQTVTEIVTDAQGSTQIQEVTEVVNVKADGTIEKSEDSTKPTEKENKADSSDKAQDNNSSASNVQTNNKSDNTSNNSSAKVENQNKPQSNKPNTNSNTNTNSSSSSTTSKPSSNSSSTSATSKPSGGNTAPTTSSKVWHEAVYEYIEHPAVTEQVWVVDKEAYTYDEPVYEYKYRTLCNDCDMDVTENAGSHCAEHLLTGGKGSYRNEKIKIQTGIETITVPEQGHYETRIVKEAYTEKKLVKEAGYY